MLWIKGFHFRLAKIMSKSGTEHPLKLAHTENGQLPGEDLAAGVALAREGVDILHLQDLGRLQVHKFHVLGQKHKW